MAAKSDLILMLRWETVVVNHPFSSHSGISETCTISIHFFLLPTLHLKLLKNLQQLSWLSCLCWEIYLFTSYVVTVHVRIYNNGLFLYGSSFRKLSRIVQGYSFYCEDFLLDGIYIQYKKKNCYIRFGRVLTILNACEFEISDFCL